MNKKVNLLIDNLDQINQLKSDQVASLEQRVKFWKDATYNLLGKWNTTNGWVKMLINKLQIAYDHNEQLLDDVKGYQGGRVDYDVIKKRQAHYKDAMSKEVWNSEESKTLKVGKHYNYPYETYVDNLPTTPKETIKLGTILECGCKTDSQRQVAKFYYDKSIPDSYGSKQGTANWIFPDDKYGRQKVNQILNTIAKNMKDHIKDVID